MGNPIVVTDEEGIEQVYPSISSAPILTVSKKQQMVSQGKVRAGYSAKLLTIESEEGEIWRSNGHKGTQVSNFGRCRRPIKAGGGVYLERRSGGTIRYELMRDVARLFSSNYMSGARLVLKDPNLTRHRLGVENMAQIVYLLTNQETGGTSRWATLSEIGRSLGCDHATFSRLASGKDTHKKWLVCRLQEDLEPE
jgi:hypothetical protein